MVEAMAAGLPIVATTHGGIPEAVDHGRDGILVPEKDSAALADAILEMLGDEARLKEYSRQAKPKRERALRIQRANRCARSQLR